MTAYTPITTLVNYRIYIEATEFKLIDIYENEQVTGFIFSADKIQTISSAKFDSEALQLMKKLTNILCFTFVMQWFFIREKIYKQIFSQFMKTLCTIK